MNIKIESAELKGLLEKVLPQVAKKSKMTILECVLIESKNNILTATATDIESFLSVTTDKYNSFTDGKILIHSDDIKIINKLAGEIELILNNDKEVTFKTVKKSISVYNHDVSVFPETMDEINYSEPTSILSISENVFTAAITKSNYFVSNEEYNVMMQYYNFNIQQGRIEALDGHRLSTINVEFIKQSEANSVLIHSSINSKLKKVLSTKSDNMLQIDEYGKTSTKYIAIKGEDFTYLQREKEGEYYKVDQLMSTNLDLSMTINTKELMDIMKFDLEMVDKGSKKPVVLNYNASTDNTHIFLNTGKYKTLDKLETIKNDMNNKDFAIAFNPKFIYEALKCVEDKQVVIKMLNPKAPAIIYAEGESYLVLPVNHDNFEEVIEYIKDVA